MAPRCISGEAQSSLCIRKALDCETRIVFCQRIKFENAGKGISNSLVEGSLDNLLQLAVVPALDASFRPSGQDLLHFPPVLAVLKNKPADLKVFMELEIVLPDAGAKIVEESLADLLGREFYIVGKVLGILELINFHFYPNLCTQATSSSSQALDQLLSLVLIEMRLYRLQHMFWVLPSKCEGRSFHYNFQTSTNLDSRRSSSADQCVFLCCQLSKCIVLSLSSILCKIDSPCSLQFLVSTIEGEQSSNEGTGSGAGRRKQLQGRKAGSRQNELEQKGLAQLEKLINIIIRLITKAI